jgi:hypothetical protein
VCYLLVEEAMSNFDQNYLPVTQGVRGPEIARRPALAVLAHLRRLDLADADRESMASLLAAEGYTIDVPIDVWGWDAEKTMSARRTYGYTWVPPARGANVEVAPGLAFPGAPSYDAKNPPLGAILVPAADGSFVTGPSPITTVAPVASKPVPAPNVAAFGVRLDDGSWTIGAGDTMPFRAIVPGPDGGQYVKDSRGFWTRYFPV